MSSRERPPLKLELKRPTLVAAVAAALLALAWMFVLGVFVGRRFSPDTYFPPSVRLEPKAVVASGVVPAKPAAPSSAPLPAPALVTPSASPVAEFSAAGSGQPVEQAVSGKPLPNTGVPGEKTPAPDARGPRCAGLADAEVAQVGSQVAAEGGAKAKPEKAQDKKPQDRKPQDKTPQDKKPAAVVAAKEAGTQPKKPSPETKPDRAETKQPLVQGYALQVGAFAEQSRAQALVADLTKAGFKAFLFSGNTSPRYRVRLGPYAKKPEAEKAAAAVGKKLGISPYLLDLTCQVSGSAKGSSQRP
ncbi:MAG: SPOR domain-containing protein [Pseudomonadota bacterium]